VLEGCSNTCCPKKCNQLRDYESVELKSASYDHESDDSSYESVELKSASQQEDPPNLATALLEDDQFDAELDEEQSGQ
jgi:hypothetical protein